MEFSERTNARNDYVGTLYGYVVAPTPGEFVSVRCFVVVDGTDVGAWAAGTGLNFASAHGAGSFEATDDQVVRLCAEWTAGTESGTECFETTNASFVPRDLTCDFLGPLESSIVAGTVVIESDGDVFVAGSPVLDC